MSARTGTVVAPGTDSSHAVAAALTPWPAPLPEGLGDTAGNRAAARHDFGYVRMIRCGEGPLRLVQGAREAAAAAVPAAREAAMLVVVRDATTVRVAQEGRGVTLEGSRFALVDLRRAYAVEGDDGAGVLLVRLPVHALCVPGAALRAVTGEVLAPLGSTGVPLWSLVWHLAGSAPGTPAAGERLGGIVVDLVAALVEEYVHREDGGVPTGREQFVGTVRRYIDAHLGDPDLSAESIAGALLVSVRYLHRLFEGEGVSVGRLIQRRRVECCARELARRSPVSTSLAAVAARWGFSSAAHFSRAFKAVHGHSPQEWRRLAAEREG